MAGPLWRYQGDAFLRTGRKNHEPSMSSLETTMRFESRWDSWEERLRQWVETIDSVVEDG